MIRDVITKTAYAVAFLFCCWFMFMAVHELGHILGGLVIGGTISRVVLHPFTISQTDLSTNPHPLFVVWMGPIVGAILPVLVWAISSRLTKPKLSYQLQFFAGFCLIANGAYIGAGSFEHAGDCAVMLKYGTPMWAMWMFGVVTTVAGFYLWHRLGSVKDFFSSEGVLDSASLWFALIGAAALLLVGFVF